MDTAHDLAMKSAPEGTLVWTERQEQGRGRLGRSFESPAGGAYFSVVLRPLRPLSEIPQLSLVCGLAVAEAIEEATALFPAIRWPNDILLNDRKVAGILVEARAAATVVGIGVNVTTRVGDLPDEATSLAALGAGHTTPYELTATVCHRLELWYDRWNAQGFPLIREALRPRMSFFGHPVQISAGSISFQGIASDLDETGRLLIRLDTGFVRPFEVGEVTLLR